MNILNNPTSSLNQCITWAKGKKATELFISLVPTLYKVAEQEGVDPTLVVVQCAKETGYCTYNGVLDESFKNTCGLKTPKGGDCDDPNAHTRFDSWEDGTLAQVQHLALYAGKEGYPLDNPIDPRHFKYLFGKCTTVESLSGNWAGMTYGQDLIRMMNEVINTESEIFEEEVVEETVHDDCYEHLREIIQSQEELIEVLKSENISLVEKLNKINELSR